MERIIFTTIYDELLHRVETMKIYELDSSLQTLNTGLLKAKLELKDSKGGKIVVTIMNPYDLRDDYSKLTSPLTDSNMKQFALSAFKNHLLLSAQDIIIYRILCSHYINNEINGNAKIKMDTLHRKYRNKSFKYEKGKDKYDVETMNAYINSIVKLTKIRIRIDFTDSNLRSSQLYKYNGKDVITSEMLIVSGNVSRDSISESEFEYNIGVFGEYVLNNHQCGQLLPMEIYSLRFNQIDTFNMSIYIARMIVMNKRRKADIKIYVSTMLSQIMKYDKSGLNRVCSYFDYLQLIDPIKRNKLIKNIETQINYILELLKSKEHINDYKIYGKYQYKYIRDGELYMSIVLKGKKGKGK